MTEAVLERKACKGKGRNNQLVRTAMCDSLLYPYGTSFFISYSFQPSPFSLSLSFL